MKTNNYTGIDPHIVAVIERQTRKLIGRYGLTASDVHDIEQDLHLKVWRSLQTVDRDIFEAAVNRIVRNAIIDMIRSRECQCRNWRSEAFSIDDHVHGADAEADEFDSYSDILDEDMLGRLGYPPSWQSRRWEHTDVEDCLSRLPEELHNLAQMLEACGGNLCSAARMLGVSRKKARIMLARLQDAMSWLRKE